VLPWLGNKEIYNWCRPVDLKTSWKICRLS